MRVSLPKNVYTQINTNPDDYLIQNLSDYALDIIVADVKPADTEPADFVIEKHHGITGSHIAGLCWGQPSGNVNITVGITEG